MPSVYKLGVTLNAVGDPQVWSAVEVQAFKDIIDLVETNKNDITTLNTGGNWILDTSGTAFLFHSGNDVRVVGKAGVDTIFKVLGGAESGGLGGKKVTLDILASGTVTDTKNGGDVVVNYTGGSNTDAGGGGSTGGGGASTGIYLGGNTTQDLGSGGVGTVQAKGGGGQQGQIQVVEMGF